MVSPEFQCDPRVDPLVDPMQGSIGVGGDHLTPLEGNEGAEGNNVNRLPDKVNAAITKQAVDAAGMEGVQLVVGPSVVKRGEERAWERLPRQLLMGGLVVVIGLARNPERGIGFGPTPVTAGRGITPRNTPRRTQTKGRADIGRVAVVITFGVGTQISWITTGILPDHDRIAGTIGDLCDGRFALFQKAIGP